MDILSLSLMAAYGLLFLLFIILPKDIFSIFPVRAYRLLASSGLLWIASAQINLQRIVQMYGEVYSAVTIVVVIRGFFWIVSIIGPLVSVFIMIKMINHKGTAKLPSSN